MKGDAPARARVVGRRGGTPRTPVPGGWAARTKGAFIGRPPPGEGERWGGPRPAGARIPFLLPFPVRGGLAGRPPRGTSPASGRALRPRAHPAGALAQARGAGLTARRVRCPRGCGTPGVPRARRGTGPAGCLRVPEAAAGHGVRALAVRRSPCRAVRAGAPALPLRTPRSAPVRTGHRETTHSTPRP